MSAASNIQLFENLLSRQISWISAADSKASFVFGLNVAMAGVLVSSLPRRLSLLDKISSITISMYFVLFFVSIVFVVLVYFPRLNGSKESNLFFRNIISKERSNFVKNMINISNDDICADMLDQIYINAGIADSKFTWLKYSMIMNLISITPWLLSIWFLLS
ncbi:MAG: hypothetical protein IAE99_04340 [Rhodothermales bacterium]|nr:hypothetical protein [Rhodothermales bacterium]